MARPHDDMPALTGVRLPLALWVVAHHLSGPGRMLEPLTSASPPLHVFLDNAWLALTVFFAISGFVLARRYRLTTWTRASIRQYAAARFGRIYPLYALSLLILAPIIADAFDRHAFGNDAAQAAVLLNHLLLLQGWHWPAADWNTPAWSLSCEVFFYVCAPAIVMLVRVPSRGRVLATGLIAFAVPVALRLSLAEPIPKALLYLGDFMVGVAAAGFYESLARRSNAELIRPGAWLSGVALPAGIVVVLCRGRFPSFLWFDASIRLLSAMLVLGLACGGGVLARALSSRLALIGGQASFAIYILHVPLLWWFERSSLYARLPPVPAGLFYLGEVLVLSVAVSRGFEPQANAIVRRWASPERPRLRRGADFARMDSNRRPADEAV